MEFRDQPQSVRPGEMLCVDAIEIFLKDTIPGLQGKLTFKQYPSGASNLTYLVSCKNRQMVLRCPPSGTKAASAHDMGREYKVLSALSGHWPYAPRPLAYTDDDSIIGCPFYVMERIEGVILRREIPPGLFTSASQIRTLFEKFVEVLVDLHALDYQRIGLGDLGRPDGYVQRQVSGWSRRYRAARTPDVPDCEAIMSWLAQKMPPETDRPTIIHNDYKLDNIILDANDPLKIIGVLDWEMTTIGDPLMDLGSTLGYWVEKNDPAERHLMRSMPTHLDGAMGREAFVQYYGRLSGRQMDHFDFYHCFGIFRMIVIVQQIYYRYYHGQTSNPRFKKFADGVPVLARMARRVIEQSDL
ncbi:aminoglycoside phosphotransferase [Desulfosarcina variabilis str. Montpellier]|uniref:phosphotransferase family protein n=1 Tax=Desulfosarcina variabilis TaxID=2300 RepID=UPI003AFAAC93